MKDSSVNGVIPSRVGYFNSREGTLVGMQLIRIEIFHLTLCLLPEFCTQKASVKFGSTGWALFNRLGKFCHSENQLEKIIDT